MSLFATLLMLMVLKLSISSAQKANKIFEIDTNQRGPAIADDFVSMCIDCVLEHDWNNFDFSNTLANTLAKGISPAYLRFSGTATDRTYYNTPDNTNKPTRAPYGGNITQSINMTMLNKVTTFATNNNWSLIFGINAQDRYKNNSWDPKNTIELFDYIITDNDLKNNIKVYEFGNEPDLYNDSKNTANGFVVVSPTQTAKDYVEFYNLLQSKYNNTESIPNIFGCDVTYHALDNYLKPFLNQLKKQKNYNKILNRITYHHYYGNGGNPGLDVFISVDKLDSLISVLNNSLKIRDEYDRNIPILLGESGPWSGDNANGGNKIVPTYAAGFMWLDQLSLAASLGLSNVIREAFHTATNSIIDPKSYKPRPDYWNTYLFRNLVANYALYVNNEFSKGRYIRLYAFCTRTKNTGSVFDYNLGSVTVVVLNLNNSTRVIKMNLNIEDNNDIRYDIFHLLGKDGNVTANEVYLNGKEIKMMNDTTFPKLQPVSVAYPSNITLHPLSYSFIVVANANATACLS